MATNRQRACCKALSSLLCLLLAPACTSGVAPDSMPVLGAGASSSASAGVGSSANAQGGSGIGSGGSHDGSSGATTADCASPDASRVKFRVLTRLNRFEYDNTARDLLGDTSHVPLNTLPADFGDGAFDNNAAALTIDPSLAEQISQVAETLAQNAVLAGSAGRKLVFVCQTTDEACAQQIAGRFAARAWRRPLVAGELDKLFSLYKAARTGGFSFDEGVQTVVAAALVSPNFLFRPEIDGVLDSSDVHAITPYELATRLSYFLWNSMPDDDLTASAASGEIATSSGLATQLTRMWGSSKAEAFFVRFPGQWLHTLDISVAKAPAAEVFPAFNPTLKAAMEGETVRVMRDFMTSDLDFLGFLDAKFTYLNATLAKFYGIPGQFGDDFVRVDLTGNNQRGGILTQAAFLTLTSPSTRTSPVMRGQWVLARLLDAAPPPPPDDIPSLESQPTTQPQTMRQKMLAHRTNASCTACHALMDPIGFGLENYDGIGNWRTTDNGLSVDASGDLGQGKTFNGGLALEALLKGDARVPRAVVKYLMSYALGRELDATDRCLIDEVTAAFQAADRNRMKDLVARVATLPTMKMRRGAP